MKLAKTLTMFWQDDAMLEVILEMIQPEVDRVEALKEQALASASLENASDWVLRAWENAYGVTPVSDSDTERISAVRAKMRAGGILTPAALVRIMASYHRGTVKVEERFSEGVFALLFTDQRGAPVNIQEISNMLDALKPAHLAYEYIYEYLLIGEAEKMTLAELSALTLDNFGGGTTNVDKH